jgi:hypothetical protein
MASEPTSSHDISRAFLIEKVPAKGRESVALRAAIKRSPIVLRLTERFLLARAWASVRKSPDVDAYVLAWIASHVRGGRPRSGCG